MEMFPFLCIFTLTFNSDGWVDSNLFSFLPSFKPLLQSNIVSKNKKTEIERSKKIRNN